MGSAFPAAEMTYKKERAFECTFQGQIIKGSTDHAIIPTDDNAAVLIWEDKNIDYDFRNRADEHRAIGQVALEIHNEVQTIQDAYIITNEYFCGILTNGTIWYLVANYLFEGELKWRHTNRICTVNSDGTINTKSITKVATMLRHALTSAKLVLERIRSRKPCLLSHPNDDTVDDDDIDGDDDYIDGDDDNIDGDDDDIDGDGGEGGTDATVAALSNIVSKALHISDRTRSNGKVNGSKGSEKSSGATGGKSKCKLTQDNLFQLNKENFHRNIMSMRGGPNSGVRSTSDMSWYPHGNRTV